jgi:DNA-binding LacI/PurR family transcriptional regulator
MALGLIHAFREAGLDVPRDVSTVGFDDIPESAHFWPPLTRVHQYFGSLGVQCVAMLLDAIHRSEDEATASATGVSSLVEPRLVIRDSVSRVLPTPTTASKENPCYRRTQQSATPSRRNPMNGHAR